MIIYKTTNIINGKYYVGKDINNSESYLGSGVLLKRAIKKYGKENFIKEVLEHCKTLDILEEREKFWIKELDSIKLGYNLTEGGTGGDTFTNNDSKEEIREKLKKRTYSEEVKKIKLKNLEPFKFQSGENHPGFGKKQTEETKNKRKKKFLENGYPMENKNHTEESKQKIRQKKIGVKQIDETKLKISVANKGKKKKIIKCPYCGKEGGEPQMYQWHFKKCKLK
jgi:group I intron endonuclease